MTTPRITIRFEDIPGDMVDDKKIWGSVLDPGSTARLITDEVVQEIEAVNRRFFTFEMSVNLDRLAHVLNFFGVASETVRDRVTDGR